MFISGKSLTLITLLATCSLSIHQFEELGKAKIEPYELPEVESVSAQAKKAELIPRHHSIKNQQHDHC